MTTATGPAVMLCTGHRCTALRTLSARPDSAQDLRNAVRGTTGAVLVTIDCPGLCAQAAVAGITGYDDGTGTLRPVWWLGQADEPAVVDAVASWVRAGPPPSSPDGLIEVPPELGAAVLGLGRSPAVVGGPVR